MFLFEVIGNIAGGGGEGLGRRKLFTKGYGYFYFSTTLETLCVGFEIGGFLGAREERFAPDLWFKSVFY